MGNKNPTLTFVSFKYYIYHILMEKCETPAP